MSNIKETIDFVLTDFNGNPNGVIPKPALKYENPTPGELPIVSTGKLPNYSYYSDDICKLIKACHVNAVQSMIGVSDSLNTVKCGIGKQGTDCNLHFTSNKFGINFYESIRNARLNGLKFIVRKDYLPINNSVEVDPLYKINSQYFGKVSLMRGINWPQHSKIHIRICLTKRMTILIERL